MKALTFLYSSSVSIALSSSKQSSSIVLMGRQAESKTRPLKQSLSFPACKHSKANAPASERRPVFNRSLRSSGRFLFYRVQEDCEKVISKIKNMKGDRCLQNITLYDVTNQFGRKTPRAKSLEDTALWRTVCMSSSQLFKITSSKRQASLTGLPSSMPKPMIQIIILENKNRRKYTCKVK